MERSKAPVNEKCLKSVSFTQEWSIEHDDFVCIDICKGMASGH